MNLNEAELKRILGDLYKEITAFKLTYKEQREIDRRELVAWSQTNLTQIQLITEALATIDSLTKALKQQEMSRQRFEQVITSLQEQLNDLKTQLTSSQAPSTGAQSLEIKGLKSEVASLKSSESNRTQAIQGFKQMIRDEISATIDQKLGELKVKGPISNSNPNPLVNSLRIILPSAGIGAVTGVAALFFVIQTGNFQVNLPADFAKLIQNSYTKLQRIESKLEAK